jgi:uncharacterized membrane protein (UPF0127 family)
VVRANLNSKKVGFRGVHLEVSIIKGLKKVWLVVLLLGLITACGEQTTGVSTFTTTPGQLKLHTTTATLTTVSGRNITLTLEIAQTEQEQETGLMGRASVPAGMGMLFVFKTAGNVAFWMKDTLIPLSIAFIDTNGKILDIQDMQAMSEDLHTAKQPYQYALEVGQGWFGQNGVKPDDNIKFELPS